MTGAEAAPADISEEEVSALLEPSAPAAMRPYDLTAQRINRTELPLLEVVAKGFAERATVALSSLVSREVRVTFVSLESLRAPDLQAALPAPSATTIVRLKPLPGSAFVSLDPTLLLALLDGFYGGAGQPTPDPQAAIAPAAQRFLALLLRAVAPDWAAAWVPVTPLELELVKQEVNPRLLGLGGPQDSVHVMRFGIEQGSHAGHLDWLLPDALLAPIREALAGEAGKTAVKKQEPWGPVIAQALKEAEIELRAILTEVSINLRELVRLAPGDIIPIEPPQQVVLLAGDVPLHRGRFGVSQGRNALKILPGGPKP